mmetsp:Transcript_24308/g.40292  ORF Transcript_24308/g.40292 Transcript_24308/m.40292 type:complete len:237 (+) Transcript_24308:825-1535(+)
MLSVVKEGFHFNDIVLVAFTRLTQQFKYFNLIEGLVEKVLGILDHFEANLFMKVTVTSCVRVQIDAPVRGTKGSTAEFVFHQILTSDNIARFQEQILGRLESRHVRLEYNGQTKVLQVTHFTLSRSSNAWEIRMGIQQVFVLVRCHYALRRFFVAARVFRYLLHLFGRCSQFLFSLQQVFRFFQIFFKPLIDIIIIIIVVAKVIIASHTIPSISCILGRQTTATTTAARHHFVFAD